MARAKTPKKVGLFGGTFNPIHFGHINALTTVIEKIKLDKVFVIPTNQNPLREQVADVTPEQRLEMAQMALKDYEPTVEVDGLEIEKGGVSYSIDTVKKYQKKFPKSQLYFICGLDAFETFDKWKSFEKILEHCHLVVTSRPGSQWPTVKEDCPKGIQKLVSKFSPYEITLKTKKKIFFVALQDKDISASDVRKKIKLGQKIDRFVPLDVEKYLLSNDVYPQLKTKIADYEEFARFCAKRVDDKKGYQIKVFDLRKLHGICEYSVVASGTSTRHALTLGQTLRDAIKEEYGVNPIAVDGFGEGRWVVLDYGGLIIHLFYDFVRQEYRLEDLWRSGSELSI